MSRDAKPGRVAAGKLPAQYLHSLLNNLRRPDPSLIVGPHVGEDAAVLDLGDRCLVVTTDPVTFAADRIGWYVVHVNANDIAVMGARPRWLFVVLLLPERDTTRTLVDSIMKDVRETCDGLGITVCGGHTEVTTGLDRPIVVGQMLGDVERSRLVEKSRLVVGDQIVLTRGIAIEGTAILAREKRDVLRDQIAAADLDRAAELLFDPGISVVEAAVTATEAGEIHAMHDPTEGGLVTGLHELATASNTGLRVLADRIPIFPETRAICDRLGLDPMRLIASGALLIGTPAADVEKVTSALAGKGISACSIAEVTPAQDGMTITAHGRQQPLVPAERDEIARVFEGLEGRP